MSLLTQSGHFNYSFFKKKNYLNTAHSKKHTNCKVSAKHDATLFCDYMQERDANSHCRGHGCGLRHRDCGGVPHHGGACHRGIGSGNAESTQLSLGFFIAILGS